MALAISAMLLVEWRVTGELALPPLIIFATMAFLGLALGARALGAIDDDAPEAGRPHIATGSPAAARG